MYRQSEQGSSFWEMSMVVGAICLLLIYAIHLTQKTINESNADTILKGALELAEHEKDRMDSEEAKPENEQEIIGSIERKGYGFALVEGSSPTLVKIETERKTISAGVCRVLKKKLKKSSWRDTFQKVLVIDRMGDEKTDILIYDCPRDRIPALRFYVKFEGKPVEEAQPEEKTSKQEVAVPAAATASVVSTSKRANTSSPSYTKSVSCPAGTSQNGKGGFAVAGCRCYQANEVWNGKACEIGCPAGSIKGGEGDETNIPGCHCHADTPVWSGKHCIAKCTGNKIFDPQKGECVCPANMYLKNGSLTQCVECNKTSDCETGRCVDYKCLTEGNEQYDDCRYGVCQSCTGNDYRANLPDSEGCEVGGLSGACNGNGTCYPTGGRRCSAVRKCPNGEFCNYGGTFNSSKKQKGKFGQTPNVCQVVDPLEFTYQNTTYYYNRPQDLKAWCRAANNKPNCKWGYLAKPGAESWCASLGKRLLTQAEMAKVWDVLKKQLPKTYTGYAYWVKEGVWLEDKLGRYSFGKGRPDGYGGRGGVVCK